MATILGATVIKLRPIIVVFFLVFAPSTAGASVLGATGCEFQYPRSTPEDNPDLGPAMAKLAEIAAAKDRGDSGSAREHARDLGRKIATYPPRAILMFLEVTDRLSSGAVPRDTGTHVAREVIKHLDFIGRQTAEVDMTPLRAYAEANAMVQMARGYDRLTGLEDLEKPIMEAKICAGRRFFLLLGLAREMGPSLARPRLEELWLLSDDLEGLGEIHYPMRWIARQQLTAEAMRMRKFDLVEQWLPVVEREAEMLLSMKSLDPETRLSVEAAWMNFPDLVQQEHDRYRRLRSVDLH